MTYVEFNPVHNEPETSQGPENLAHDGRETALDEPKTTSSIWAHVVYLQEQGQGSEPVPLELRLPLLRASL